MNPEIHKAQITEVLNQLKWNISGGSWDAAYRSLSTLASSLPDPPDPLTSISLDELAHAVVAGETPKAEQWRQLLAVHLLAVLGVGKEVK